MARHNNTARSLIIISKANGWDPCKIEGSDYPHCEYPEERVTKGDTPQLQGPLPTSPETECPYPPIPGADDRGNRPFPRRISTGNPYAGKSEADS